MVMMWQLQVLSLLLMAHMTMATNATKPRGCQLIKPDIVHSRMVPEQVPLLIYVNMERLRIRDVPVSGGSIGIEFL